jgi:hypothetical protein
MSAAVVRGIAGYDGDDAIKECLQTLFNWELANSNLKNPQFKSTYVRAIEKGVSASASVEGDPRL